MSTALDAADLPPLRFQSAADAYRWAEETASRPGYSCPIGRLGKTGGGGWSREDYLDLAYSILAAVAGIEEPFPREMFRYVHGAAAERLPSLGGRVGESLMGEFPKRTYSQLRRIGEVAVMRERAMAQRGQHLGLNWYARGLGIQRPSLYDGGWRVVIKSAEASVHAVSLRGEGLASDRMSELGIIQ